MKLACILSLSMGTHQGLPADRILQLSSKQRPFSNKKIQELWLVCNCATFPGWWGEWELPGSSPGSTADLSPSPSQFPSPLHTSHGKPRPEDTGAASLTSQSHPGLDLRRTAVSYQLNQSLARPWSLKTFLLRSCKFWQAELESLGSPPAQEWKNL